MKKIVVVVLLICAMLSACAGSGSETKEPEGGAVSDNNEIKEEEAASVPEEESSEEFWKPDAKELIVGRALSECASGYFLFERSGFEGKDFSASFKNTALEDKWYWSSVLKIENGEKSLSFPVEGIYILPKGRVNASVSCGKVILCKKDLAAFCGMDKVVLFNPETMEIIKTPFEIPSRGTDNTWVNAFGYSEEEKVFYLVTTGINKNEEEQRNMFFGIYDESGKLISEKEIKSGGLQEDTGCYLPKNYYHADIINLENREFFYSGDALISFDGKIVYNLGERSEAKTPEYTLEIFYVSSEEEQYNPARNLAVLSRNGEITEYMLFEEDNFSESYEAEPVLDVAKNGKKAVYYCDYFAMTLTLDFENESHTLSYNPKERHIDRSIEGKKSQSGKYGFAYFGRHGGGDIYYSHIAVEDFETGEFVYIGQTGGMYGGYGGSGFFKNDDIYLFSTSKLDVIDPKTSEIKFSITENFPLGYDEKTDSERGLLTFRRDPEDFSWITVYYEYENGCEIKEVETPEYGWHEEASCNYKIGFHDSEGNLIESYDTGMPVWCNQFGLHNVDMRYSEEKLTLIVRSSGKGLSGFDGFFDLETHEFTHSLPGK